MIETTVHIVWDETGAVAAHTDADEAADLLEAQSSGRFKRLLALTIALPPATPIAMSVAADDVLRPQLTRR